jgi:hypothetical protein
MSNHDDEGGAETQGDLFTMTAATPRKVPRARTPKANGYYYFPGSGPEGETCGSCCHCVWVGGARRYYKCDLTHFTRGPATDIRVRSPACRRWEKAVEQTS